MKPAEKPDLSDSQSIHLLPHWVSSVRAETPETVAFLSGAALAMLDLVLRDPGGTLPSALLRDRLALDAAVTCLKLENRNENPAAIRDAVCLARAGEALGPAGGHVHGVAQAGTDQSGLLGVERPGGAIVARSKWSKDAKVWLVCWIAGWHRRRQILEDCVTTSSRDKKRRR